MVVDDNLSQLHLLADYLTRLGYHVRIANNATDAIDGIRSTPPDLILLDTCLTDISGFEICRRIKQSPRLSSIPIIFVSGLNNINTKVSAFEAGGVDFIIKPFELSEVRVRLNNHLHHLRLSQRLRQSNADLAVQVRTQVEEVTRAQMATILAMSNLAESRDADTGRHLQRVQAYCRVLAEQHQRSPAGSLLIDNAFITNLVHACPLHDIGKISVPDAILLKPGPLTPDEFAVIQHHSEDGARTLETIHEQYPHNAFVNMGIEIARSHHEKWNGQGYPQGLAGAEIPLCARIVAVADVYDALTSARRYKPAFAHEQAREILIRDTGRHFDPAIVDAFIQQEDEFIRIGSQLSDGSHRRAA